MYKFKDVYINIFAVVAVLVLSLLIYNYWSVRNLDSFNKKTIKEALAPVKNFLTQPLDNSLDPTFGSGEKVYFYADFKCAACAETWKSLKQLQSEKVKFQLIWKDVFDPSSAESLRASIAARCAGNKFWDYVDRLFANQNILNSEIYSSLAADLKLNTTQFKQCQDDPNTLNIVRKSFREFLGLGLDSTPAIYVKGRWLIGKVSPEDLKKFL